MGGARGSPANRARGSALRTVARMGPPDPRMHLAVALAIALASSHCVSLGDAAAWADGEVRALDTRRPIRGALVFIESAAGGVGSAGSDRTNEAGHFAVYRSLDREHPITRLVVVAEGFKPAEYSLPILQSNSLIVRLAPTGSSEASRVEQMPAPPGESDGNSDSDCSVVRDTRPRET